MYVSYGLPRQIYAAQRLGGGGLINSPLFVHHLGLPAQAHEFMWYLWVSHCLTTNKTDSESNGKHKNWSKRQCMRTAQCLFINPVYIVHGFSISKASFAQAHENTGPWKYNVTCGSPTVNHPAHTFRYQHIILQRCMQAAICFWSTASNLWLSLAALFQTHPADYKLEFTRHLAHDNACTVLVLAHNAVCLHMCMK